MHSGSDKRACFSLLEPFFSLMLIWRCWTPTHKRCVYTQRDHMRWKLLCAASCSWHRVRLRSGWPAVNFSEPTWTKYTHNGIFTHTQLISPLKAKSCSHGNKQNWVLMIMHEQHTSNTRCFYFAFNVNINLASIPLTKTILQLLLLIPFTLHVCNIDVHVFGCGSPCTWSCLWEESLKAAGPAQDSSGSHRFLCWVRPGWGKWYDRHRRLHHWHWRRWGTRPTGRVCSVELGAFWHCLPPCWTSCRPPWCLLLWRPRWDVNWSMERRIEQSGALRGKQSHA